MTAVADPFAKHATLDADPFAKHAAAAPAEDPFAKHATGDAFGAESAIDRYGRQYGVDANFARQIQGVETGGTPSPDTATSKAGARGRFQLMPATFKGLGVGDNITDPDQNVHAGVLYLSQQLKKYHGNQALAAAAYNAGPGAVDAYLQHGTPLPAETVAYAAHFGTLPQPTHNTSEADFRNRNAQMAIPAHPAGAGVPAAPSAAQPPAAAPLALQAQISGRPQAVEDPFAKHAAAQTQPNPAYQPAAVSALEGVGETLTAGTPAGGIVGGAAQDAIDSIRYAMTHNPEFAKKNRTWDAIIKTITGHAGEANRAYGAFETPTFTGSGLGGAQGAIQRGDRAAQAAIRKLLPPERPGEEVGNPEVHALRQWANNPNDPVMTESVIRGIGEFAGTLGRNPGNLLPGAVAGGVKKIAQGVPKLAREEVAAIRQINPAAADTLAHVGEKVARAPEAVDRYANALRDVHPADRPAAQAALRMHDTARARSIATADKLVDSVFRGAAPGADDRIIDAYQALYKGERVVNAATDQERIAAQALRDAAAGDESLATRTARGALTNDALVSKTNPAGLTEAAQRVLAEHPDVDPERAVFVAQAMEHAERMPPNLTPDEIQRAKKLAQAEAIAWSLKSRHPELVAGIDRERELGYFPMANAFAAEDMVGGGRAVGQHAAVDYSHLKPAQYQTVAEARLRAPEEHPDRVLFGNASPREVFRRAMQRQIESAFELDAQAALRRLRSNQPGRMLIDRPSYVSPLTGKASTRDQALKDLEKARIESARPAAVEDVLGPGATMADLPKRRPRLATLGELRGVGRAAQHAHGIENQAQRDLLRAQQAAATGAREGEDAASAVAGITAPTERVSGALEPQIDRLSAFASQSAARLKSASQVYAQAVEDFGAESAEARTAQRAWDRAAQVDARMQTRVDAAKGALGGTLNRTLGGVQRSVAGQAREAAGGVSRAAQQGAERTNRALETTFARIRKGAARFDDRYKSALLGRELSLQQRDLLDRFDKALEKHIADQGATPKDLFDPESIKGYQPLSRLRQGLQGEDADLHAVDGIHKYLAANHVPPDVDSAIGQALDAARRIARSTLIFNPIIHTGWNEGGIVMAQMGPAGANAVLDAFTSMGLKNDAFEKWFNGKEFSSDPGDTMRYWDTLVQKHGAWAPHEYGSYAVGDAREVARDETGRITGYRDTPGRGVDYATMRTAPLSSLGLKDRVAKIGYEMQRWNSNVVFSRGERIYAAYLMRHFVKDEGLAPAEAANKVRASFSDDTITDWEKNGTRSWMFFYPWMRTVNRLAIKLGIQKPQTVNAPLQGSRVQRETVGGEGVQMSKSNPYALARPSAEGGFDYWAPPIWNRSLEPAANLFAPTGPSMSDRVDPAVEYLAGHLAPLPGMAADVMQEARMGGKVPPWEQVWDPYAPGLDAGQIAGATAGQFLYPLRQAEEISQKPAMLGTTLLGGSTGHRAGMGVDEAGQRELNAMLHELQRKQKEQNKTGNIDPKIERDIESLQARGAY